MRTIYLAVEILLLPIAVVNFSICFIGTMAVLGLTFDSPLLLQVIALGVAVLSWVMNAATPTISRNSSTQIRLLWLAGMLFSVMAVAWYCLSLPIGEDFSSLIVVRP